MSTQRNVHIPMEALSVVLIPASCVAEASRSFCCFFPLPNVCETPLCQDWQMLKDESEMPW